MNSIQLEQANKYMTQQKRWVACHSFIFLFLSISSLLLLIAKKDGVDDFLTQEQCCYCSFIGEKHYSHHEIEWSTCKNNLDKKLKNVCTGLNDTTNNSTTTNCSQSSSSMDNNPFHPHRYSTTSSFILIPFPKYYPYYGIQATIFSTVYVLIMWIPTYCNPKRLLSTELFVGNIVISMLIFYAFIKAFQYAKTDYSKYKCNVNAKQQCYVDVIDQGLILTLHYITWIITLCAVAPFFLCCFRCVSRKFTRSTQCAKINSYLERLLLIICVMVGIIFLIIGGWVSIELILKRKRFDLIPGVDSLGEKIFIIVVTIILFVCSLDVFLLSHCRKRCKLLKAARTRTDYVLMLERNEFEVSTNDSF